ncbi:MAG: type III-A CRISPR-associated protein Cas10/Csm1, partial [Syntrophobacterales bacterium]|nr:type III-A CRISPR-associated protein Cas10/Csm1 [Syntrophobacterales bacterium]
MDDTILKIAIAGLLHDIGKLMQRAELEKLHPEIKDNYGDFCPLKENFFSYLHAAHTAYFVEKLIPENLFDKTELYNAARHHKNPLGDIYRDADCISAGMERYSTELDEQNYKDVRLQSIFEEIELQYVVHSEKQGRQNQWIYKLAPSSHDNLQLLYPLIPTGKNTRNFDEDMTYENLWRLFVKEIKEIKGETNIETYFHELLWLLEKYTSCIPSATNVLPDISLYDHAKTTAAIASILYLYKKEHPEGREPFILYTGDISGIQDYIFRISRIQGMGGIAKRLRGRSFYIMMLGEIIARHIIHAAGLTEVNINFCGGGNVELLLPNTDNVRCLLADVEKEINLWLREKYHGTLSFNAAWAMMSADGLRTNYVGYRDIISHELEIKKMQRNKDRLHDETFWIERKNKDERITVCRVCNLNLVKAGVDICNSCASDKDIGAFLPKAGYIRFSGDGNEMIGDGLHISFDKFGWVSLFDKGQSQREMILPRSTIYGLDCTPGVRQFWLGQSDRGFGLKTTLQTPQAVCIREKNAGACG